MGKVKIIGTGLSGLVGTRLTELLKDQYEFENLSLETGFDITDKKNVFELVKESDASAILHMAAKTNVDDCDQDREKDIKILKYQDYTKQEKEWKKENTAWFINVIGTKNIAEACQKTGKKVFYISTDFVFDGEKRGEGYKEEDIPNPINWYARTKYEGEKIVQNLDSPWVIMRIAYPYRASFQRSDFARGIIRSLKNYQEIKMVTDHMMTPTFIDDIAKAFDVLLKNNSVGIFHTVGSQFVSPWEAGLLISKVFDLNEKLISKTTRLDYFKGRAKRPFDLRIRNDKIQKLGLKMLRMDEGLEEIKKQMENLL